MTKKEIINGLSVADFSEIISKSLSYRDASRAIGIAFADKSNALIRERCERENLSLDHMLGCGHTKGKPAYNRLSDEDFFTKAPRNGGRYLRERLLATGVKYECAWCFNFEWRGERLNLEVDHIDGNHSNNTLTNLRLLCPNCHSQTPTWGNWKR